MRTLRRMANLLGMLLVMSLFTANIARGADEGFTPETLQTIILAKTISGLAGALDGCGRPDAAKTAMTMHFDLLIQAGKMGVVPENLTSLLELGFKSYDENKSTFSKSPPIPCSSLNDHIIKWSQDRLAFENSTGKGSHTPPLKRSIKGPTQSATKSILDAVDKFGASISCSSRPTTADRILTLDPGNDSNSSEHRFPVYAVIWDGDIACDFNGRLQHNIAIVMGGIGRSHFVVPRKSEPIINVEPFGLLERIIGFTEDSVTLESVTLAGEDPRCCPTNRRRVTLKTDLIGNWSISNIVQLPKK